MPDSKKLRLQIIIASTRPGRVGLPVAKWVDQHARSHSDFDVQLVDLAEVNLPILDEPFHPRLQKYQHEHTRKWSQIVSAADAFTIVTPEYNFGPPPALVNALNYLYLEWNYKPAGFVSYGGISGGLRSVQMTKLILTTLKIVPIYEAVTLPFVNNNLSEAKDFVATETRDKAATEMLKELHRWALALKPLRG
jgi:NAD(P)H-dependent FMN reductase